MCFAVVAPKRSWDQCEPNQLGVWWLSGSPQTSGIEGFSGAHLWAFPKETSGSQIVDDHLEVLLCCF